MKIFKTAIFVSLFILASSVVYSQEENCFLEDFEPKIAVIPGSKPVEKPAEVATGKIQINRNNVLRKVSKYIFGNALAVWMGNEAKNPVLYNHLENLAPAFIRYPGGSWSDIFFWDGNPVDIPDSIVDGNTHKNIKFYAQLGKESWPTTVDNYYDMVYEVDTKGLITINYGYARYGTGDDPVAQAAHYAAEWVRYDDGRTKFWEIGNENGGPWEAGWEIDPEKNKDGQPKIISGELYGKHVKIIVDSMRAAAAELDETIYIGGQIIHFDPANAWNEVDKTWNEGFLKEAADAVDFYVVHNYFGGTNAKTLLNNATNIPKQMMDFIKKDLAAKNAPAKPVALTEYNMDASAGNLAKYSFINGMQSIILFCELIKNEYDLSCRWLIASGEDGMFYQGNNTSYPKWSPRPEFFYAYYLQKFYGDHTVESSTDIGNVMTYASIFISGEIGLTVVNKSTTDQVIEVELDQTGIGQKYYIYSLTGGSDNGEFSQYVYVNGEGPTGEYWGPVEDLLDIPADAFDTNGGIKFISPARSVQFILIESDPFVKVEDVDQVSGINKTSNVPVVYPNPASGIFNVDWDKNNLTRLEIFDILGRVVYSENISNSRKRLNVNPDLSSGLYFLRLHNLQEIHTTKLIIQR